MVRKIHLLAINGLMWTAIGTKIAITGVSHYIQTVRDTAAVSGSASYAGLSKLCWMIPLSALVFAGFYLMFTGVVRKYSAHIHALPGEKQPVYKTFSVKGYLIIAFMISLGIILKHIPGIPASFFAWFYCGLGPGLLSAGIRFLIRWWKARDL